MSDNFDWRTEDDFRWEQEEPSLPAVEAGGKRPWRSLAIIGALLVLAGLVLYWQVNRRLEALTATVEADVLSTHNLINQAVLRQDAELMAPLLSGRDLAWTKAQESLLEQDLFYARPPFGLRLAESGSRLARSLQPDDAHFMGITVAPDMNAAELAFRQDYETGDGQSVTLQQTAVYRRGRQRWLLSPPDEAFWGDWQTMEAPHVTLIYPARDEAVAARLGPDLSEQVAEACQSLPELDCAADIRLQVRLDTSSASLLAAADPATLYDGNLRLDLPAPTLIGLPLDESGYTTLRQGYGSLVTAVVLAEQLGWACCEHAPLYQAILEYQLAQMALRPWPVGAATHAQVVNNVISLDAIFSFWSNSSFDSLYGPDGWQMYAFVDFLMRQHPTLEPLAVLQGLNQSQTFQQWLSVLFHAEREQGIIIQEQLSRDWWLYAHGQMLASQGPQPIPFPDQDIQLTCTDDFIEPPTTTLLRYSLATAEWTPELTMDGYLYVNPLPQDEAVVLQVIDFFNETWYAQQWQNGEGRPFQVEAASFFLTWGQVDPTRRYLLAYINRSSEEAPQTVLVDIFSCLEGACEARPIGGIPSWSPDGSQMILQQMQFLENGLLMAADDRAVLFDTGLYFQNAPLFRSNATAGEESRVALGEGEVGNIPFWLDEQTYGYVRSDGDLREATQALVIASTVDDVAVPVLTAADLLAKIPEDERPFRLSMRYVIPHPTDANLLLIAATSRSDSYLFLVDLKNNLIENRLRLRTPVNHIFGFSPDGRYLVATGSTDDDFSGPGNVGTFYLHDVTRNETQTFIAGVSSFVPTYNFDWSADGNWLVFILNNGAINLVAPEYDYQHVILHDFGNCSSIAWVNPAADEGN